ENIAAPTPAQWKAAAEVTAAAGLGGGTGWPTEHIWDLLSAARMVLRARDDLLEVLKKLTVDTRRRETEQTFGPLRVRARVRKESAKFILTLLFDRADRAVESLVEVRLALVPKVGDEKIRGMAEIQPTHLDRSVARAEFPPVFDGEYAVVPSLIV